MWLWRLVHNAVPPSVHGVREALFPRFDTPHELPAPGQRHWLSIPKLLVHSVANDVQTSPHPQLRERMPEELVAQRCA